MVGLSILCLLQSQRKMTTGTNSANLQQYANRFIEFTDETQIHVEEFVALVRMGHDPDHAFNLITKGL